MAVYITFCVLEGDLTAEDDITREQGEDFMDMLESRLKERFPDADIAVDMEWNMSGYSQSPYIVADTWQEEAEIDHEVHSIQGDVWMEWCEKHNLA